MSLQSACTFHLFIHTFFIILYFDTLYFEDLNVPTCVYIITYYCCRNTYTIDHVLTADLAWSAVREHEQITN